MLILENFVSMELSITHLWRPTSEIALLDKVEIVIWSSLVTAGCFLQLEAANYIKSANFTTMM